MDFSVPADNRVKSKESEKKDKYLDPARELKKIVDVYTNYNWYSWYSHWRVIKGTGGLGNKRTGADYSNYSIIEIRQNTEMSPVDLRRLVVT